jgi:hypothetical protein
MVLTEALFMGNDRFYQKMKELIYPAGTPQLNESNSILL